MKSVLLRALGTAVPRQAMSREQWLIAARERSPRSVDRAILTRIAEHSGVENRWCACGTESDFYPVSEDEHSPGTASRMDAWYEAAADLAVQAAQEALGQSEIASSSITHCITASCTGFRSPGVDAYLIERLRLPRHCQRVNVGFMGCHAAVNALTIARAIAAGDPAARVLICCVEVCSAHFHRSTRRDRLIANALFGDGAAAAVVMPHDSSHPHARCPELTATCSTLIPGTAEEMSWQIGDHGFEMSLSPRVPEILKAEVGPWVQNALQPHGLAIADVKGWAIHPGGPRVIDAVVESLGISSDAAAISRSVLRECGNMSSGTLLFILARMLANAAPRPWVGLAFGPGLVGEMVLLR